MYSGSGNSSSRDNGPTTTTTKSNAAGRTLTFGYQDICFIVHGRVFMRGRERHVRRGSLSDGG